MKIKRNISMMLTAIAAFFIIWSTLRAPDGPAACAVTSYECVPVLLDKLGFPEQRQ